MTDREPDLFDRLPDVEPKRRASPPVEPSTAVVIPFPMQRRVGKIRDVARKLLATKSDRHAASYRHQVTEALLANFTGKCVPADLHPGEIVAFWRAVNLELARLQHGRQQA